MEENHKKGKIGISICLVLLAVSLAVFSVIKNQTKPTEPTPPSPVEDPTAYQESDFNLNLIKTVNSIQKGNYLISPYSIEVALSMLREGSSGTTLEELNTVVPKRDIPDVSIKNRIGIANAIFLKDRYADFIEKDYMNQLTKDYQSEVIVDKFQTPKVINDWANKNTYKMIPKVLEKIDDDFVLGLANAVAIDVEWANHFECENTSKEQFTKVNHEKINVEMMHQTFENNASYFETKNAKGIILPYDKYDINGKEKYKDGKELEFIGILPTEDVYSYIEKLTQEELKDIEDNQEEASKDLYISLSLPRFSYNYNLDSFRKVLMAMGIKTAFDQDNADFTKIISRENMIKEGIGNLYVDTTIHKTYIDLNEKGTKAAALTFIGLNKETAAFHEPRIIKLSFNKPFAYMIRDKETKEILFFGVVNKPNLWKKTTCEES